MISFSSNRFFALIFAVLIFPLVALAADDKANPANDANWANIVSRDSLKNARIRFEQSGKGHVAFIGGSITEMNGYRPLVMESLKRRFPKTEFTFTNAGISSTCSTTGAFRLQSDVLDKGTVDLFFIEFAVNDDQDAGHARRECLRGMEGILRQARQHNPQMDIVITYFVNEGMLRTYGEKKVPVAISAHEEVADHYHVSTVHLAREVTGQIWRRPSGTVRQCDLCPHDRSIVGSRLGKTACGGRENERLFFARAARPLVVFARTLSGPEGGQDQAGLDAGNSRLEKD
jgi:lysophospholipase L1-like esterase